MNKENKENLIPVKGLSPFKRFCMTIGELPTSYLETMTYYEMLVWFTKYMQETVIPTINNNASAVDELQNKYIEFTDNLLDRQTTFEEEVMTLFNNLQDFVNNYFNNLDVQEEINNKLDQMVEDGILQEIITQYINATALWCFDNVSNMQSSTNLIIGSYAKTLGYYSINDGGGAIYKIIEKETPTANGNININENLDAKLISYDICNVKQFGAKGNDTDADDTYFNAAINYAKINNLILYVPIGTYKLVNQIDLRSLNLNIEGVLDNNNPIIIGGDARETGNYDIKIYKTNNISVKGLKNSSVKIIKSDDVILSADNNINTDYSIAYNIINIIDCKSITLTGSNGGWINENVFNIKRLRGNLTITGDGSYYHNNNIFEDVCIEGSEKVIQIDYGHNNYITYRGEQNPHVVLPSNNHQTFGNIIQPTYAVSANNFIRSSFFNPSDKYNVTSPKYLPTYQINNLLNLNTSNFLNTNASIFLQEDGKLHGDWAYTFETGDIPLNEVFTILVNCDVTSQRIYVTFKDVNGDKIEGDILSSSLTYDTTNKQYKTDNNVAGAIMTFIPSTDVKTVNIQVRTGGNASFSSLKVELISRFTSLLKIENIRNKQREMSTTPSLTDNAVWTQGDFVKNLAANQNNGIYGWVCVTSGTGSNSVWRKIETSSI